MVTPTVKPPVRFKTPAVCFASMPAPIPLMPGQLPESLYGWFNWTDLDPANEVLEILSIKLKRVLNLAHYVGQSPQAPTYISINLEQIPATTQWELESILHREGQPDEDFTFDHFHLKKQNPFDTGLLNHIFVTSKDFREARFST